MKKKPSTIEGTAILFNRYLRGRPAQIAKFEEARAGAQIARMIYDLREQAGLTQKQLAQLVGTTASVICRLEDADYSGHSLGMLRRIASALKRRVEVRLVPLKGVRKAA